MIAALAGRRVDASEAGTPRFPLSNAQLVAARLHELFVSRAVKTLVCSAACGADLIALETAGELGIRRRVVLPFPRETFRETSVVDRPGEWGPRYDHLLDELETRGEVLILDYNPKEDQTYTATNTAMLQEALGIAGGGSKLAVVVWEGRSRGTGDVTEHFLNEARNLGFPTVEVRTI
jgi:hypothetical protein